MQTDPIADIFANRNKDEPGPCPWNYIVDDKTYQETRAGFWGPNEPVVSDPLPYDASGKEIVVVSDLHMASGRTPVGVFRGSENFFTDEGFSRFLDHVETIRSTPSMLLIINGDLFDFLRVTEYPGWTKKVALTRRIKLFVKGYKPVHPDKPKPAEIRQDFANWSAELSKVGIPKSPASLSQSISKTEKKYGLETDDYKTIYKLIRIKRGHPGFFYRLARWLLDGNSLLILKGNHDLELCQPNVRNYIQLQLAETMAQLSPGISQLSPGQDPGPILEKIVFPNIRFADDSVLIEGDFYLEHGHRYDKYTMVTGNRFLSNASTQINIPFGSFFNRYLINRIELYYPYFDKIRPTGSIIPMLVRDNFALAVKIIFQQIPFLIRILCTNGKYIWFMVNRVIWLLLIILVPVILLIILDWHPLVAFVTGLLTSPNKSSVIRTWLTTAAKSAAGLLVSYFIARVVSWFQLTEPDSLYQFARTRRQKPASPFRIMTMGHTHNPGEYFLPDGTRYYNTGTWIPVIETSSAEVREDHMYTFLHLQRDAGGLLQVAEGGLLQRWNDDAGRAEPPVADRKKINATHMPIQSFAGKSRVKWKNYVDDQESDPLQYFSPTTLQELRDIVLQAERNGYNVKAIGSGHSSSDIAISRDYMINTWGLNRVLDKGQLQLKPGPAADTNLLFLECGIKLKDLNTWLDGQGKALLNMGAYTGQTLAGVVSTSTHGSGITLDAFPAYVEAIILLGEGGRLYQIERSDSISTGAGHFEGFADVRFICNDKYFKAAAVSMGCMGIIYAVVLRVTASYWLEENRHSNKWSIVRQELKNGDLLTKNRHVEVLVNPYPDKDGDYNCMVTKRCIDTKVKKKWPFIKKGHRQFLYQLSLDIIPAGVFDFVMRTIVNCFPKRIPWMAGFLITSLTDRNYIDKSYKVLDLGKANNLAAFATEICFPADKYIAATEALIAIVAKSIREGSQYLAVPFSLRFVKTNDLFLSMQYRGDRGDRGDFVCMIEFPTVSKTTGGLEMLSRIESAMYAFGGIPHWGQINHVGGAHQAALSTLYPEFGEWMKVYQQLCPRGTFQNDFMRRCGIV